MRILAGYYSAGAAATAACSSCGAGTYANAAASACTTCPANSNSLPISVNITDCTCNNGYGGPNGGDCRLCEVGSFVSGIPPTCKVLFLSFLQFVHVFVFTAVFRCLLMFAFFCSRTVLGGLYSATWWSLQSVWPWVLQGSHWVVSVPSL